MFAALTVKEEERRKEETTSFDEMGWGVTTGTTTAGRVNVGCSDDVVVLDMLVSFLGLGDWQKTISTCAWKTMMQYWGDARGIRVVCRSWDALSAFGRGAQQRQEQGEEDEVAECLRSVHWFCKSKFVRRKGNMLSNTFDFTIFYSLPSTLPPCLCTCGCYFSVQEPYILLPLLHCFLHHYVHPSSS